MLYRFLLILTPTMAGYLIGLCAGYASAAAGIDVVLISQATGLALIVGGSVVLARVLR